MTNWMCFGQVLAFLAAVTLALVVADVILTSQYYCVNGGQGPFCQITANTWPYWPVWVAVGIWGSAPVFATGLMAMCAASGDPAKQRNLSFLLVISAVVFTPAIVVISAIEIWRGAAAKFSLYSLGNGVQPGTITPPNNPYQAKFAIPLAIAILGGIMHIMTAWIVCVTCCCGGGGGEVVVQSVPVAAPQREVVIKQVYQPPRPQIVAPPCDPCSRYPAVPYPPVRYSPGGGYNFFPSSQPRSFHYGNRWS